MTKALSRSITTHSDFHIKIDMEYSYITLWMDGCLDSHTMKEHFIVNMFVKLAKEADTNKELASRIIVNEQL